ncbi:hypothetical protein LUX39_09465 [Actinomadura madurae]|nr:hypothetical protein [Actinomadura madurae]MCP9977796.1 hypothetical protein [Actinomadura madurae]MCQ0013984.1 hypothetical protein [Actinomadura madurae]
MSADEERDGVRLTNLDQPLFDGADATKRDLVDYLDAVADRIVPQLAGRPLSVKRVLRGQKPFMQKNTPKYTPSWVRTVAVWAESSQREVSYALCDDRRTLLWFANQRAVEYHPPLVTAAAWTRPTHMVLDIDPPEVDAFDAAVAAAHLVRRALEESGLRGAVKTSGAKGVHVFVPWTVRPPSRTSRRPPAPWPPAPSGSTPVSPRPRSSARTAAARCSSTRPARAARPWSPPTARGSGPARRCRSPCRGTSSTASPRRPSRCGRPPPWSPTATSGPTSCPSRRGCPPT